ncbi:UNVERIFIED_CONTAM: hypothetical protein Sradi_0211700 [Sesamum radiatum]|uniref:Uncharacterized protein n=1 Tax=Sesamum radiatum TaxID=300843 RepID=A0AAW2W0Z0_SESRA
MKAKERRERPQAEAKRLGQTRQAEVECLDLTPACLDRQQVEAPRLDPRRVEARRPN